MRFKALLLLLFIFLCTFHLIANDFKVYEYIPPEKIKKIEIIEVESHHLFRGRKEPKPFSVLKTKKEIKHFKKIFKFDLINRIGDRISGEVLIVKVHLNKKILSFIIFGGSSSTVRDLNRTRTLNDINLLNEEKFYKWIESKGRSKPLKLYLSSKNRWFTTLKSFKNKGNDALKCKEPEKMQDFLNSCYQSRNIEIFDIMTKEIENNLTNKTTCILDGFLLLDANLNRNIYKTIIKRSSKKHKINNAVKKYENDPKYKSLIKNLLF